MFRGFYSRGIPLKGNFPIKLTYLIYAQIRIIAIKNIYQILHAISVGQIQCEV